MNKINDDFVTEHLPFLLLLFLFLQFAAFSIGETAGSIAEREVCQTSKAAIHQRYTIEKLKDKIKQAEAQSLLREEIIKARMRREEL